MRPLAVTLAVALALSLALLAPVALGKGGGPESAGEPPWESPAPSQGGASGGKPTPTPEPPSDPPPPPQEPASSQPSSSQPSAGPGPKEYHTAPALPENRTEGSHSPPNASSRPDLPDAAGNRTTPPALDNRTLGPPESAAAAGRGQGLEHRPGNLPPGGGKDGNRTPPGQGKEPGGPAKPTQAATGLGVGKNDGAAPGQAKQEEGIETHSAAPFTPAADRGNEVDPPRVRIEQEGQLVAVARGSVEVASHGVGEGPGRFLVLIHPDGREQVLAENATRSAWNTSENENGYYTVELRERKADGSVQTLARTQVLVTNPRATVVGAVAAVVTGAAASAAAGALASRGIDVFSLVRQSVTELSGDIAEERVRTKTASMGLLAGAAGRTRWWNRLPGAAAMGRLYANRRLTLAWIAFAGLLLALFKAYSDTGSWEELAEVLPIAGTAVLLFTVSDYSAEWALARATGASARFRLWAPGTLSLILSSVVFRSAFGYPGYMQETDAAPDRHHDEAAARRLAGIRALAFIGMGIGLTLPFTIIGGLWRWDFAEYGVGVALMTGAAATMPFSPMPGRDVWGWSKGAWAALFLVTVGFYLLWQLAALPLLALEATAVVAIGFFVLTLVALRRGKI